jgi:hypothetical protein
VESEDDEIAPRGAPVPWWRRTTSAVLAAAASVVLVVGLAVPALQNMGGGADSDESATAQQAPAAAAGEPEAPTTDTAASSPSGALAVGPAERDGKTSGARATAENATAATGAAAADAAAAPADTTSAKAAKRAYGGSTFNRLVACARAIVVGEIVRVEKVVGSEQVELTIAIDEYVTGSGAAERTFTVGSSSARFVGDTGRLAAGQRGLFLIPGNRDVQVQAWLGDDVPTGRKEVRAAQAQRESC